MISLFTNYRGELSITVKTLNHSSVRTVIQSNAECGDQGTDLNPVFLLEASWSVIRAFLSLTDMGSNCYSRISSFVFLHSSGRVCCITGSTQKLFHTMNLKHFVDIHVLLVVSSSHCRSSQGIGFTVKP